MKKQIILSMSISLALAVNSWAQTPVVTIDSKNAGDSGLQFKEMDENSTATTGNGTNTVLSLDANGNVILVDDQTSVSGITYTADNGITLNGTNFQWGGSLIQSTTITTNGNFIRFSHDSNADQVGVGGVSVNNDAKFSVYSLHNEIGSYAYAKNNAGLSDIYGGYFRGGFGEDASVGVHGYGEGSPTVKGVTGSARSGIGVTPTNATGVEGFAADATDHNIAIRGWAIGVASTNTTAISGWADRPSHDGFGLNVYVNNSGNDGYGAKVEVIGSGNDSYGTWTKATGGAQGYGVLAESRNATTKGYGIDAKAMYTHPTPAPTAVLYGVKGYAYNGASSATNYSVYGSQFTTADANDWAGYFAGNVHVTGAITSGSDRKLKENLTPLSDVLDKIAQINSYEYNFKSDYVTEYKFDTGKQIGFVAQEIQAVFPHLVKEIKNPGEIDQDGNVISKPMDYLSVEYAEMIPVLLAALKEQQAQIEELKNNNGFSASNSNVPANGFFSNEQGLISNSGIVPNPNDGNFKYQFQSTDEGRCTISVLSSKGVQVIPELDFKVEKGSNSIQLNMINSESAGTYILIFEMNGETVVEKFIKQ